MGGSGDFELPLVDRVRVSKEFGGVYSICEKESCPQRLVDYRAVQPVFSASLLCDS